MRVDNASRIAARLIATGLACGFGWWVLWALTGTACDDGWDGLRAGRLGDRPLARLVTDAGGCAAVTAYTGLVALAVLAVVQELLRRTAPTVAGVVPAIGPAGLRRVVLGLCGLGLTAGLMPGPALATTVGTGSPPGCAVACRVVGLALPDLPSGRPAPVRHEVTVRSGDSLWAIATHLLGGDADVGEVAAATATLFAHNRTVVGPDPDLIHPGTTLTVPEDLHVSHP